MLVCLRVCMRLIMYHNIWRNVKKHVSAVQRVVKHVCGSLTWCMWKLLLFPNSWLQNWVDLLEGSCLGLFFQWSNLSLPIKYDLWLWGNVRGSGSCVSCCTDVVYIYTGCQDNILDVTAILWMSRQYTGCQDNTLDVQAIHWVSGSKLEVKTIHSNTLDVEAIYRVSRQSIHWVPR